MALIVVRAVVAFVVFTCVKSASLSEEDWTSVARCRTKCIEKFVDHPVSDNKCTTSTDCFMCWQMCEKTLPGTWNNLCEPSFKDLCPPGCRTACDDVIFAGHNSATSDHTNWSFTYPGQTKAPSHDRLLLAWQRPRLHGITDEPTVVILYVVMWSHGNQGWKYMYTTSEVWAQIDGRHSEYQGLAFRILAVTDNGKIAETSVAYPPKGYTPRVEDNSLLTSLIKKGHHATQEPTDDDSVTHHEDIDVTTTETFQESSSASTSFSPVATSDDVSEISATREEVVSILHTEEDQSIFTTSTEQTTLKSDSRRYGYWALLQITNSLYVNLVLVLCVLVLVLVLAAVIFKNHRNVSRLTKLQAEIQLDMRKNLESNKALGTTQEFPQVTETDQPIREPSIVLVHSAALNTKDSRSPVVITLEDDISVTCTA